MYNKDLQSIFLGSGFDAKEEFDQLFLAYYQQLVRFAAAIVVQTDMAEDVVADVFAKLWQKRNRLTSVNNIDAYLYTAVKNACFDELKREQKRAVVKRLQQSSVASAENQELPCILKNVVNGLPHQQRLVFLLIKEHGKTSAEVASILDLSPRTVETHLYKAVKTVANSISQYLGYHPQHRTENQES